MILNLMKTRRSVRRFKPDVPDRAVLEQLIDAATTAPSASNKQAWRFLITTDRERIANLAERVRQQVATIRDHIEPRWQGAFSAYGQYFTRFEDAPVLIAALAKPMKLLSGLVDEDFPREALSTLQRLEERSAWISTSLAIQNLLLMAHHLGLGATVMTGPLVVPGAVRDLMQISGTWEAVAFLALGYPDETPAAPARKPLTQVIRWLDEP